MKKCSFLMATNLNVWSLSKGSGAPSFFKTLELYNQKGHKVYLYSTEPENPVSELINVKFVRLPKLSNCSVPKISNLIRIVNYFLNQVIFLYFVARNNHKADLLYAYEIEFVPAMKLLSWFRKIPLVTRFQGTILHPLLKSRFWRIRFFPHYMSLKLRSNLTIMTNDGTKGDVVLSQIRGANQGEQLFLFNGADRRTFDLTNVSDRIKSIAQRKRDYDFISVSRLEKWKRVDRSIEVFKRVHKVIQNSRLLIVGDGNCLEELSLKIEKEGLSSCVSFIGSINRDEADFLMANSDVFLSHYELSNVGNPLWEALCRECLVVTIKNGDTGEVIEDGLNGIISEELNYLDNSRKIIEVIQNKQINSIQKRGCETYSKLTVSWDERMEQEYSRVAQLLRNKIKVS